MLIYDGHGDKITPQTDHTVQVISANIIHSGDHMTLRVNGRGDYSLFFIFSGKMTFDDVLINKNQIWIYPPNVRQEYFSLKKDNATYYYIHFTGNKIDELMASLKIPLMMPLDFPFDKDIFEKIIKTVSCDDALSKIKSEFLTLELLSYLAKIKPVQTKENMMKQVLDEMHHSYFMPYDVNKFASMVSLSVGRFNHLFKEVSGKAPQQYYNGIRMENAAVLLTETTLTITEVAQKTGFSDPLYFGQVFKKYFGVSPKEYRQ